MNNFHTAPNTFVEHLHLYVRDFDTSFNYYQSLFGFNIIQQTEDKAVFSVDGKRPVLIVEQGDHVFRGDRVAGLYHFAILLPERKDLGAFLAHLIKNNQRFGGTDGMTQESIYFSDPDGNGIEVYADKDASTWVWENGQLVFPKPPAPSNEPINLEDVLAEAGGKVWDGVPEKTVLGHLHLRVTDMEKNGEFYIKGLGLDVVLDYGNVALFLATGRYHHHIAINIFQGPSTFNENQEKVGMGYYSLKLPSEKARTETVRRLQELNYKVESKDNIYLTEDPSGNKVQLII